MTRRIGEFEVLGRVGSGGMGDVYRVRDPLGRELALKLLPPGLPPVLVERFHREARALARLEAHAGIVDVHATGEDDGRPWYVMDLVEGRGLRRVIAEEGPMDPVRSARVGAEVGRALHYGHENGIVHRDVKPQNVVLGEHGPVLIDFGLARDVLTRASLTRGGDVLGSPAYMPPEQATGDLDLVGPPSDVYGLGATLYACLAGRPPFVSEEGSSVADLVSRILYEPVPPLDRDDLPTGLQAVLDRSLAKMPADRYPTARALADDLDRAAGGRAVRTDGGGRSSRWKGRSSRRTVRMVGLVAGVSLLLLLLLGVGGWWMAGPAPDRDGDDPASDPPPAGRDDAAPPAGRPPLHLYLSGETARAVERLEVLEETGEATSDDRVLLARALVELDRGTEVRELADRYPGEAGLEVVATLARLLEDETHVRGVEELEARRAAAPDLAREALARLHLEGGRPLLAAELLGEVLGERGMARDLAERTSGRLPGSPDDLLQPDLDRTRPPAPDEVTRGGRRVVARAMRVPVDLEILLAGLGGRVPPDPSPEVCAAVARAVERSGDREEWVVWAWAASERDATAFIPLFRGVDATTMVHVRGWWEAGTHRGTLAHRFLPEPVVRRAAAVDDLYKALHASGGRRVPFERLAWNHRQLRGGVRERTWSAAIRLYRGLIAHAVGYPRAGRADVRSALAMAADDAERAALAVVAAEVLAPEDRGAARGHLSTYRRHADRLAERPWLHRGLLDGLDGVGDLRDLR